MVQYRSINLDTSHLKEAEYVVAITQKRTKEKSNTLTLFRNVIVLYQRYIFFNKRRYAFSTFLLEVISPDTSVAYLLY